MKFRHGGDISRIAKDAGMKADEIIDFSANINPLGPPKWLRAVISSSVSQLVNYPEPFCGRLTEKIAKKHGISADEALVGNGSTELLYALPRAIAAARALIPTPAYVDYALAARAAGVTVVTLDTLPEEEFALDIAALESEVSSGDLVFIGTPNNPTGVVCDARRIRELAKRSEATFVIDEAFADFVDGFDSLISDRPKNVIVMRSMTKQFAIPGLRLGYIVADPKVIRSLRSILPPWSVNTLAQQVGAAALLDADYIKQTQVYVSGQREKLFAELSSVGGLHVYPGAANYLLARLVGGDAVTLAEKLLRKGIAIRVCDNYDGLDESFFRVAVKSEEDNDALTRAIREALGIPTPRGKKRKSNAIMFQGTSSNAGKSVMTAALCRILLQDGYDVAPFKAQNMSLNSFVTIGGGEMGRAQVVQARACRLEPDVRMNPLLLKPSSDTGSQVILHGKPLANMSVKEYYKYKEKAAVEVRAAYDSLAAEHDIIVLEGAGSPAEINLKRHDLVNMKMARYAAAPVLLVGDIDLGGIFAAFTGTMELLEEWERRLVAGFIINRFRGDASLLADALTYTERHTTKKVLGVVPFIRGLGLPEEDSVEFKSGALDSAKKSGDVVEIAVIDLPHISNFTDFDPLRIEPDVHLRIVRDQSELRQPDAVIIPGSKNVPGDFRYLKESGIAEKLLALHRDGKTEIIGICGGFQMLGEVVRDPHKVESTGAEVSGLGILGISTSMAAEKTLERVTARHIESGLSVHGYEIHHGQTTGANIAPLLRRDNGTTGARLDDGRAWGTYMHGIFDADRFRRWFIDRLRENRGLPAFGEVMATYDIDVALDRLADVVRESLPIDMIYKLAGLK